MLWQVRVQSTSIPCGCAPRLSPFTDESRRSHRVTSISIVDRPTPPRCLDMMRSRWRGFLRSTASFAGVANPHRIAPMTAGATVVDIGCGAGMDLLLAAQAVGPDGRAIGVDMTEAMAETRSERCERHWAC